MKPAETLFALTGTALSVAKPGSDTPFGDGSTIEGGAEFAGIWSDISDGIASAQLDPEQPPALPVPVAAVEGTTDHTGSIAEAPSNPIQLGVAQAGDLPSAIETPVQVLVSAPISDAEEDTIPAKNRESVQGEDGPTAPVPISVPQQAGPTKPTKLPVQSPETESGQEPATKTVANAISADAGKPSRGIGGQNVPVASSPATQVETSSSTGLGWKAMSDPASKDPASVAFPTPSQARVEGPGVPPWPLTAGQQTGRLEPPIRPDSSHPVTLPPTIPAPAPVSPSITDPMLKPDTAPVWNLTMSPSAPHSSDMHPQVPPESGHLVPVDGVRVRASTDPMTGHDSRPTSAPEQATGQRGPMSELSKAPTYLVATSPFSAGTGPFMALPPDQLVPGEQEIGLGSSALTTGPAETAIVRHVLGPAPTFVQVNRQLVAALTVADANTTEVALNPEELGRVRMQISTVDGIVSVSVHAEKPETLDLIRRHADQLAEELQGAGYDDIRFDFGQEHDGRESQGHRSDLSDDPMDEADSQKPSTQTLVAATGLDLKL